MYSARSKDYKTTKYRPEGTQNSNLDASNHSNKSKQTYKDFNCESRNLTPTDHGQPRPSWDKQQIGNQKIKLMLNNLVQPDSPKMSTMLFTQNLSQRHNQFNTDASQARSTEHSCNLCHYLKDINSAKVSLHNPPMSTKFQLQISKTPKHQDGRTTPSQSKHDPQLQSNRDTLSKNSMKSLYYLFQNKQSDPNILSGGQNKQAMLTLSQLVRQGKSRQPPSSHITPEKAQVNYLDQIKKLKSKLDSSLRPSPQKPAKNIEKPRATDDDEDANLQNFNQYFVKQKAGNNNANANAYNYKSLKGINAISLGNQNNLSDQNALNALNPQNHQQLIKLCLQKEFLWNQLLSLIDNIKINSFALYCNQLSKMIMELSEKSQSEKLYKIEPYIIDTLLLESYTVLIISAEYIKINQQPDMNLKNLIVYITYSNYHVLYSLNCHCKNDSLKVRLEMRQPTFKKKSMNGNQTLLKNNDIIRSILELILSQYEVLKSIDDTSRPEFYNQIGFNHTNLDMFLIQQRQLQVRIDQEISFASDTNSSLECSPPKSASVETKENRTQFLPIKTNKQYTLVLDLDETLVHYQEFPNGGGQFLVRPFAEEFLQQISKHYEIVIFTAAMSDYANFIIDIIDKHNVVAARLFREHTTFKDNVYLKDLSILGRNLSRVIIVDNMPENFQLQPENGIFIQSWFGEQKDRALKDLQPILEEIAIKKSKDVRTALNNFREQMIERVQQGIKHPYSNLQLN